MRRRGIKREDSIYQRKDEEGFEEDKDGGKRENSRKEQIVVGDFNA